MSNYAKYTWNIPYMLLYMNARFIGEAFLHYDVKWQCLHYIRKQFWKSSVNLASWTSIHVCKTFIVYPVLLVSEMSIVIYVFKHDSVYIKRFESIAFNKDDRRYRNIPMLHTQGPFGLLNIWYGLFITATRVVALCLCFQYIVIKHGH